MPPSTKTAGKWIALGVVLCAFLVADYALGLFWDTADTEWVLAVLLGVGIGQLNLIATWAALAPGNFVVRLPWALALSLFTWYSLVLGCRGAHAHYSLDEAVVLGVVLLGGLTALQIPLWIAGRLFRWRLAGWSGETREESPGRLQFHLGHLLLAMLFVSLALAPGRMVLPPGEMRNFDLRFGLLVLLAAATACNLLIAVPCIWGAFLRRRLLVPVAFGWVVYCALVTALEHAAFVVGFGFPVEVEPVFLTFLLNVSQCAAVFGTLLVFRALGFRLLRVPSRRQRRQEEDNEPASSHDREALVPLDESTGSTG